VFHILVFYSQPLHCPDFLCTVMLYSKKLNVNYLLTVVVIS
jgi:hypothetical protein